MRQRTVTEPHIARPRYLKLQCPECTRLVRVARDELVEGATAYCRHCGTESELALGFNGEAGSSQWMLLDPLLDLDDDEEEQR